MLLTATQEILKVSIGHKFMHKEFITMFTAISYKLNKVWVTKLFQRLTFQLHSDLITFNSPLIHDVVHFHKRDIRYSTI